MAVKLNTQRKGVSITWLPGEFEGPVTITATGENGDVHSKVPVDNSGEAGLFFPVEYEGKASIEVRDRFDDLVDTGTIKV
jgi:hypothetical protein